MDMQVQAFQKASYPDFVWTEVISAENLLYEVKHFLNLFIDTKWRQWKEGDQVAGYVQKYKEGNIIVTVKGAGHMVPQDQNASAFSMVNYFLKDNCLKT